MNPPSTDNNFEKFRKDRRQRRAQFGANAASAARPAGARDAEAYEAKQVHETRLSRDVHEFLAEATKQAATIVEKVTMVAEAETAQRLSREMQEFLQETMRRAATFMHMVQASRGKTAVKDMEPHVSNLVGPTLDGFRHEGTAQLADKHIGQDPFAESPEPAEADDAAGQAEEHEVDTSAVEAHAATEPVGATEHHDPAALLMARVTCDVDTLKRALKALVGAKVLSQDDARAIYRGALQANTA